MEENQGAQGRYGSEKQRTEDNTLQSTSLQGMEEEHAFGYK